MGQSGADLQLSPAAHDLFPYNIECKNQERLSFWSSWEQAKSNKGDYIPILFVTRNRSDKLVVLDAKDFINMIKRLDQLNGGNL